ncbi:hypothetical protein [Mucilaginibacter sp. SP1R1]|uniref:hypothetical protein n=1 Tax=Mucilaginibacter sp. SP1R1 TaxID=2723091 RepID=UPI00160F9495|nr:hypothetical protein [Mucilaginibacter sp. SP1R1]MBB6149477.1 hypothetical protein [Mucilaginibacter sp. SP1R1]
MKKVTLPEVGDRVKIKSVSSNMLSEYPGRIGIVEKVIDHTRFRLVNLPTERPFVLYFDLNDIQLI